MKKYSIAVTEGDGIGPEIIKEAIKVLTAVGKKFSLAFEFVDAPAGGNAYKKLGSALPPDTLQRYRDCDAVLKAPVGLPDIPPGLVERDMVLAARQELDLYVNLRPVKLFDCLREVSPLKDWIVGKGIDLVIVRENSEGAYCRRGSIGADGAMDESVYTEKGVDRIIKYAFEYAKKFDRRKVTSVDKANVLQTSKYWRSRFDEIRRLYPQFETESIYVDAMSQFLIKNPYDYDVLVTDNLFGDILSDEAAEITGSLGLCGGANTNPESGAGIFEPIHGSAPKHAGTGIANPTSMILAVKMMLEHLGERQGADAIYSAVEKTLAGGIRTKDIAPEKLVSTSQFGDEVAKRVC